jgi:hypothetical protein
MSPLERVTVTLPREIIEAMDRMTANRSRFILEAVQRELNRRRRETLSQSLRSPMSGSPEMLEEDFETWAGTVADKESTDLVDMNAGRSVHWVPGTGWVEDQK